MKNKRKIHLDSHVLYVYRCADCGYRGKMHHGDLFFP